MAIYENKPIAFIAVKQWPHPHVKNFLRVHRLVVLPDYQGIGIGIRLLEAVGNLFILRRKRYIIATSNIALVKGLEKNPNWKLKSVVRNTIQGMMQKTNSAKKYLISFEYAPKSNIN